MPIVSKRNVKFTPQKKIIIDWDGWADGWNEFFNQSELKPTELSTSLNTILTGKGTVTGRWGSDTYVDTMSTTAINFMGTYIVPETSVNEFLTSNSSGYLLKKSGASVARINGVSWTSGYPIRGTQLGGNVYLVSKSRELVKYNGSSLIGFATVSKPTSVTATNLSGVTGLTTYSWRITASTQVGETLPSDNVSLGNLPQNLGTTSVKVAWTAPSAASGQIVSYSVYRGNPGEERYLSQVGPTLTSYFDTGIDASETILAPLADTTGGPKAGHILSLDDRLVLSDFPTDPSLVMFSGRYPYEARFNWVYGGGYVRIAPNDGDRVTCTSFVGSNVKGGGIPSTILVFKENRTFALVLKTVTIGNYILLDPQYQELLPVGTKSPDSVVRVENDVFFLAREGLYSVGSEANYLNEIRSREISTAISNYMDSLTDTDYSTANAIFIDQKYILSFPSKKECIVYDYERKRFVSKWSMPFGINKWFKYIDTVGDEQWLAGTTDGKIKYFSETLTNDSGESIGIRVITKKETFNDWTVMKIIEEFYMLFRAVRGTINISINGENRSGYTINLKSFSLSEATEGSAGYGSDQYGVIEYGTSTETVNLSTDEFTRWGQLYKTIRSASVEIFTTETNSNFELISIRMTAQPLGIGSLSPSTRI